jgi:hypothetical protein
MQDGNPIQISIPSDCTEPLPRQKDGGGEYLHCTGGLRAAKIKDDAWQIEPILSNGVPSAAGFFSLRELQVFLQNSGFTPIAFESFHWRDGNYHSNWSPLIPKRQNHFRGPSDLWVSISTNLSKTRRRDKFKNMKNLNLEGVAEIMDDCTREEALARSISLSLRSMDISVEKIADFYNEQVTNLSASGKTSGQRASTSLDQALYAHVHSFFLHLGSARDYLASILALKLEIGVDSFAKLIPLLREKSFGVNPVLDQLRDKGFLVPDSKKLGHWLVAGWLKDASELRNQFVHTRPYGLKFSEGMGWLIPVNQDAGLFRYFRPIHIENQPERDVLDEIVKHYKQCTEMFQDAAEISGQNTEMLTITQADILSINITRI